MKRAAARCCVAAAAASPLSSGVSGAAALFVARSKGARSKAHAAGAEAAALRQAKAEEDAAQADRVAHEAAERLLRQQRPGHGGSAAPVTAPVSSPTSRGGVKYERNASTKMKPGDLLCPQNRDLVDTLTRYADLMKRRGNMEMYESYTMPAAGILDNIRKYVAPVATPEEVKNLRLRFVSTAARTDLEERVREIASFGSIAELEEDPAITARKLFQGLPGLSHMADDFVMRGYRTIDDLLKAPESAKWSSQQIREVRHFYDFRSRVTCAEGVLLGMLLKDFLHDFNRDLQFSDTSAFRRREMWAREKSVRVLITHPSSVPAEQGTALLNDYVAYLMQHVVGGGDWEIWMQTPHSVTLKARVPPVFAETTWRKLTIRFVPHAEWVPQLLEETGHERFLTRLKGRMEEKGWQLTPTAIKDSDGNLVTLKTEEELFARIEEPYIPPWDRTEQGPQLNRKNNQYVFQGGEYKEKPRAHRVRRPKGAATRSSYSDVCAWSPVPCRATHTHTHTHTAPSPSRSTPEHPLEHNLRLLHHPLSGMRRFLSHCPLLPRATHTYSTLCTHTERIQPFRVQGQTVLTAALHLTPTHADLKLMLSMSREKRRNIFKKNTMNNNVNRCHHHPNFLPPPTH